jgi:hypothetical protein
MKNAKYLLPALFTGALALAQTSALADSAINIENNYAANSGVVYDDNGTGNYPIITTILSAPSGSIYNPGATLDGYTYGSWAYFAADTTGSLDLFYSKTANTGTETVPTVGDTILASGNWSPFDGIPEVGNSTANPIVVNGPGSQGNPPYAPGAPVLTTIPTINVGTNGHALNMSGLAGYYLQLNNVTISSNGITSGLVLPTHANATYQITDGANNSMTMFFWASSYSKDGAMGGDGLPTGPVTVTGFVDDFGNSAEFIPMSIGGLVVPEPSVLNICGLGSALAWVCYRLRKKA